MKKNNNSLLNKKFPTFVGGLILVVTIVALSWINHDTSIFGTKAAGDNSPKQLQISNITDTSFTISYFTGDQNIGTLSFGGGQTLGKIALDDRDKQSATPSAYRAHFITVQNLIPSTKYYFNILSGDKIFMNNNQPYEVVTAPHVTASPLNQNPVAGKVALDDGTIPTEAIAYISSGNSQLVSVLLKPDGSYLLPLNTLRKADLSAFVSLTPTNVLHLQIFTSTLQSDISLLESQINPVPAIILSKNYDFAVSNLPLSPAPAGSSSAQASSSTQRDVFPASANSPVASAQAILSPDASGSMFGDPTTTPPPFNLPSLEPTTAPSIASPTSTPSPTSQPTLTPTVSLPSPTVASSSSNPIITANPPLPKTGSSTLVTGFFVTLFTTISGVIIFFLARGGSVL